MSLWVHLQLLTPVWHNLYMFRGRTTCVWLFVRTGKYLVRRKRKRKRKQERNRQSTSIYVTSAWAHVYVHSCALSSPTPALGLVGRGSVDFQYLDGTTGKFKFSPFLFPESDIVLRPLWGFLVLRLPWKYVSITWMSCSPFPSYEPICSQNIWHGLDNKWKNLN